MAERVTPKAGLGTEAAIAPPISACAVAVIKLVYPFCQSASNMVGYLLMFPVLFSIGNISISSFGLFLALGIITGVFLVWRLSRAWDLSEEKVLDLTLLTLIGGLISARVYFAIENLQYFIASPFNLFFINKVPGFSFWGGFLGGWLSLYYFTRRFKGNFWQFADIAAVGLLGGLILSDIGCFLGGCNIGAVSKAFIAVPMVGFVGKRWPVQIVEALLLSVSFLKIWSSATHFHQRGKIVSLGFIYIGAVRLVLEPFKSNHNSILFSLILIILGLTIFYKITRQNPVTHIKQLGIFLFAFIFEGEVRRMTVQKLGKSWYNHKINLWWKVKSLKKLLRRFNVKFS